MSAEVGKVTFTSNGNEALSNVSPKKVNGDEALNPKKKFVAMKR
jgi:hypothetical protein